nr:hypothetical protein [Tanacetum cinerariifolium]
PKVVFRDDYSRDTKGYGSVNYVEPIVPRLRNNRDAHLDYLTHLKESVETIRDIVEEAKVLAYIPLIRTKQVTVAKPSDKSDSTTHRHVVTVKSQKTNVLVPPSTGVNSCPNASGSQPKSHVKSNKISPAKGVNKLPVEDQPRTNKSHLKTSNYVDSSSHLKCTVINSNSDSMCQTCNKCLTSSNYDMCVATCLQFVVATPFIRHNGIVERKVKQVWKPKQVRQVWKPTGKVLTTIGHQWRPTGQIFNLWNQCPLTRWVPIGKSNCYLDLEKSQSNPIYKIVVDLLKITNFFRAFTASSTIPSIYIQQFWDTILYDKKAGCYRCQLDEQWFHPRPDSPLHLLNKEPVLGYLKFSAKGTKREVFGMPILGSLITTGIQQASYYREYLAKVAQHRRYMAGETGGVQDSPAPKPTQPARKPKTTAPKAPSRPSVSIPVRPAQPAPTSAQAKQQEKKRKQATETSDKPSKAKKSKHGWVSKKRSRKNEEASKTEEVPTVEPQVENEDADYQKVLEESIKDAYALPRGTLPPVVIREPEFGKYQPLPEVPGKGKAKVTEEQVAHDLLSLQKHKKTSPVNQYIFQRRVSEPTGSSGHDESPYALLRQSDSKEESEKFVLGGEEGGQDKGQAGPDPDAQAEDQTGSNAGQAGPDPGDVKAKVQSIPSHMAHVGSDRKHMDLDVADVSHQPSTEQLDKGFTTMAYSKVQENLKLVVEEQVLLEEPANSSGTLSSLQHLIRDFSFGDQFFSDKPSDADKNAKTKVESMVNVTIQQALSSISLMTSSIIDLTLRPESPKEHHHGSRLYILEKLDIPQQVSIAVSEVVTDAVDWAMQVPLRNRFRDLSQADMKEILHQRMWESESYKSHEDHMQLFEALEKSMNRDHSEPPPPPLPAGLFGALRAPGASESAQVPPSPPPPSSTNQESPSKGSAAPKMDEDMGPVEQAQLSDDEDIGSAHIPTVNLRQGWWKPFEEERPASPEPAWSIRSSDMPTGDMATFIDWFYKRRGITELKPQDLEGPTFEIIKVFHPDVIHLQYQIKECHKLLTDSVDNHILRNNVSKPLPLGGPPGQVTIQSDFFFNKDLDYLRYGSKGNRHALSISKIKAAYYPDVGLEKMRFYIDRHTSEGERSAVRTHMRILSVVRIKVFSMYGYDYMKKIVLRRADLNEHVIAERDFKYLYLSDFEDLYLLNLQGHLNYLPPKDEKILTTAVNQWTRQLVIRQRVEDFQLGIESYQTQMMMRFNEIYKFSDGTLQQIDEALDYRVKEFRINKMNPGLKYEVLDQKGRRSVQRVHVRDSEAFEDTEDLPEDGNPARANIIQALGGATISSSCTKCRTSSPINEEKALVLHTLEEKSLEEDASRKKETNDEPLAKKLKFLIPSLSIPSPTPLKSIMPEPPKATDAIKVTMDEFTKHLSKTTSSIFSPTPPREPTPPRDSAKGKEVAITEEQVNKLVSYQEEGCSNPKMPKIKSSTTSVGPLSQEEFNAQIKEMKMLADLKAEKEKSEQELRKKFNQATLKARHKNGLNMRQRRAKFLWVINQVKKLGLPPPPALKTLGMTTKDKKRKRIEILKEVFVTKNIAVDGMHRNLIPPFGVIPIDGLVINKHESGIFFMNRNTDIVFQREEDFHLATTV